MIDWKRVRELEAAIDRAAEKQREKLKWVVKELQELEEWVDSKVGKEAEGGPVKWVAWTEWGGGRMPVDASAVVDFDLMNRRPPTATLFPYTTLFRVLLKVRPLAA